ncbi:MAG: ABC transporter substrate-binding protein [Thermodesulfobacteriota bacterium]
MRGLQSLIHSIEETAKEDEAPTPAAHLDLLLYSPCPVKLAVKAHIDAIAAAYADQSRPVSIHIPMGCTSIDPYDPLCLETDPEKLPAVIASIGFGDFWKTDFVRRFVKPGLFEAVLPSRIHPLHEKSGLIDPDERYTIYGVNPYIFLVDTRRLGARPVPRTWEDLFHPQYRGDIVMCGDGDDMADAVVLNIYKEHGHTGLERLAENVSSIMHSSQMAKIAGSSDPSARAVFIIPYFFAVSTRQPDHVRMGWPEDGAAASPLYLLAKKSEQDRLSDLLAFFTEGFASIPSAAGFIPVGGKMPSELPSYADLKWVGWRFVRENDIHALREELNTRFRALHRNLS